MNPSHSIDPLRPHRLRPARALALAAGTALVLSLSAPPAPASAESSVPTAGLVAQYVFDQTAGSSVPNEAGTSVGAATVVAGTDAQWTGTSLTLLGGPKTSSTANWVRLPSDLLGGASSATVTIETKLDASMKDNWNFLWNIGSESTTQYYFASVRDTPRTAITTNGGGGEVNARSGTALAADRWYSLTSVIDADADLITFYVDGEKVAETSTPLTPASITDQSLNAIGRAPYPDAMYKGEVATFRVYDRALSPTEVDAISTADAAIHAPSFEQAAHDILDSVADLEIDDSFTRLPDYGGRVSWSSTDPDVEVEDDGRSVTVQQPAPGSAALQTSLTATATVRGTRASREVRATVLARAAEGDAYGYAMVHFIEDSAGYAEKIYLDVSRGDDPEQWDPLNGGKPILASQLGTTGVRDPYLTFNPETGTYYIIATDLRVFDGDRGTGGCTDWCYWGSQGSTKLSVWESKDLVTWSDLRQFDVAVSPGNTVGELGMAWAPEATWVDGYNPDGSGAFVLYWSANVFGNAAHTGPTYSRILWGSTTDFSQETYRYGGVFIDDGGNTIDTTVIQNDGKTYRITKDNSAGKGIYMESTTAGQWWKPEASWTPIQNRIGAVWSGGNAGGVEGPAVFQRHGEDQWYLYVDVIPSTGYRPMQATDLDAGWTQLTSGSFFMSPSTKHGGIVGLTKGQYDAVRAADASGLVESDLGSFDVDPGADADAIAAALPADAVVTLAYGRGTAQQPITWDVSPAVAGGPGTYDVTGVVRTIGSNLNEWVGAAGSTAWNAPDRRLYSSTALTVTAHVTIPEEPLPVEVVADTRCVAGKAVLTVKATNTGGAAVTVRVATPYGTKSVATLDATKTTAAAFSTRIRAVPAGVVTVTASAEGRSADHQAAYSATTCG